MLAGDKAEDMVESIAEVFYDAGCRCCTVHFYCNVPQGIQTQAASNGRHGQRDPRHEIARGVRGGSTRGCRIAQEIEAQRSGQGRP